MRACWVLAFSGNRKGPEATPVLHSSDETECPPCSRGCPRWGSGRHRGVYLARAQLRRLRFCHSRRRNRTRGVGENRGSQMVSDYQWIHRPFRRHFCDLERGAVRGGWELRLLPHSPARFAILSDAASRSRCGDRLLASLAAPGSLRGNGFAPPRRGLAIGTLSATLKAICGFIPPTPTPAR